MWKSSLSVKRGSLMSVCVMRSRLMPTSNGALAERIADASVRTPREVILSADMDGCVSWSVTCGRVMSSEKTIAFTGGSWGVNGQFGKECAQA